MSEEPSPTRVFLVDDHPAVRQGLALMLGQWGYTTCGEADDTEVALAHPALAEADIVIVDLSLAHETGFGLIERLKADGKPVVVYSMYEDSTHVQRAFAAGASGYVTKRETAHTLADALQEVTAGRQFVSQRAALSLAIPAAADPAVNAVGALSKRELEIYERLGTGETTGEIASKLAISTRTVESYCSRIIAKMGFDGMRELRRRSIQQYRTAAHEPPA